MRPSNRSFCAILFIEYCRLKVYLGLAFLLFAFQFVFASNFIVKDFLISKVESIKHFQQNDSVIFHTDAFMIDQDGSFVEKDSNLTTTTKVSQIPTKIFVSAGVTFIHSDQLNNIEVVQVGEPSVIKKKIKAIDEVKSKPNSEKLAKVISKSKSIKSVISFKHSKSRNNLSAGMFYDSNAVTVNTHSKIAVVIPMIDLVFISDESYLEIDHKEFFKNRILEEKSMGRAPPILFT